MSPGLIKRLLIAGFVFIFVWLLYVYTPLGSYFSLEYIKEQSEHYRGFIASHYYTVLFAYLILFITTVAFSLPSSIVLSLLGGALFGAFAGACYAVIAVLIGVALACMIYKKFLFASISELYADRIEPFRKALREYGVSYLLMLHFSAVFPYFIINAVALLADVPLKTIMLTTFVGFLPQAFVYAFAGKELGSIRTIRDIFSPEVIGAFVLLMLLALVPILFKRYKRNIHL